MTAIKKKLVTGFLVFCMLATFFYSPQTRVTAAAEPSNLEQLLHKMDYIYYLLEDNEKQAVLDAMAKSEALIEPGAGFEENLTLINEIWDGIEARLVQSGASYDHITKEQVLKLLSFLGTIYQPNDYGPGTLSAVPADLRMTLDQLVDLAEMQDTVGTLTKEDLAEFSLSLENAGWASIPNNFPELFELLQNKTELRALLGNAVDSVFSSEDQLKVKDVFSYYGVTSTDMRTVLQKLKDKIDPNKDAAVALLLGYLRSMSHGHFLGNPLFIDENGLRQEYYDIQVANIQGVPVTAFTWESTNPGVSVEVVDESYLEVKSTTGQPGKTTIKAYFNLGDADSSNLLNGKMLFETEVSVGKASSELSRYKHSMESDNLHPGQTVMIQYKLNGFLQGELTNSAQLDIEFDPSVFELYSNDVTSSLYQMSIPATDVHYNNAGKVSYLIAPFDEENPVLYRIYNGAPVYELLLKVKADAALGETVITTPASTIAVVHEVTQGEFTETQFKQIPATSLALNVAEAPLHVTEVSPLADITVPQGTALENAGLPATANISLSNGQTAMVPVTWDGGMPAYDSNAEGIYAFTGTLDVSGLPNVEPSHYQANVNVIVSAQVLSLLKGYVGLTQGSLKKAGVTVTAKLNGEVVNTTVTNDAGLFELGLADGTYTIELTKPGYLKRTINNVAVMGTLVELSMATSPIPLLPGDVNGDTLVNAEDLSAVLVAFGSTISNAAKYKAEADFNGDTLINAEDLSAVLVNFGKTSVSYTTWVKP